MYSLKDKLPKYSVLMSVYKNETSHNLAQALDSILIQSYQPYEMVIVQDGPISQELCNVISNFRINATFHVEIVHIARSVGLGLALRKGTNFIKTDWIGRMDSDDVSVGDRFEMQMTYISSHLECAVVGGQVLEFEENIDNIVSKRKVPTSYKQIFKFAKYRNPFNHPTVVVRTKLLKEIGGYEDFSGFEDYQLWMRMLANKYLMINLPGIMVYMRTGKGMYNRRGGIKYLIKYIKLRNGFKNMHIINNFQMIIGDLMMICNVILPKSLRKVVYQKMLHKG